jgi:uncharacterized protein YcnI
VSRPRRPPTRRLVLAAALTSGAVALAAAPAAAHIHTDPAEAEAGSTTTVAFEIEHGCEGSPTVDVAIEIPVGVNDVTAEPLPGWSASVESGIARWTGGPLPDDSPGLFPLRMTLPAEAGPLAFPLVQRCERGSLDWIEETVEGQPEPEHPAPILLLTAAPPGSTTASTSSTTTTPTTTTTTTAPTTTSAPAGEATGPVEGEDGDDGSALPYVLGGLAAAAVIGGGGYALARSRRQEGS